MGNNYNKNDDKNKFDAEALKEGLITTPVGLEIDSVIFKSTTEELGDFVVDHLQKYGIFEADHCLMFPTTDRSGLIDGFESVITFNTKNANFSNNKGREPNIKTVKTEKFNNDKRGGRRNLMAYAGNMNISGGPTFTDNFKKYVTPLVNVTNDNTFIIKPTPQDNLIAIESNFWKLMSLLLGIDSESPYNFKIIDCEPVHSKRGPNYLLKIAKEVVVSSNRRQRSTFDYNYYDNEFINSFNKRR